MNEIQLRRSRATSARWAAFWFGLATGALLCVLLAQVLPGKGCS